MEERRIRSAIAMSSVRIVEAVEASRATMPQTVVDRGAIGESYVALVFGAVKEWLYG